jgi:iron complex outermembrane receptor protein
VAQVPTPGVSELPLVILPTLEVIGTTPLPGIGIDPDKLPSNFRILPGSVTMEPAAIGADLEQHLGSVNINANQDNPFQPDVQYRGFEASPVLGTPIGVAVYQNGIRLNEPFGDNINWDLVPDFAVHRLSVIPANPVYGLNALGGAIVIDMKTGFNYHGGETEISGGSFGRRQLTLQYGEQIGDFGAYIGVSGYNDDGFRKFSPSQVRQLYADIGAENEHGSLHWTFTGADNDLVGIGPTPVQLVAVDRSAVFTSPQKFHNTLAMTSLTGNYIATDALSFQTNFYLRSATRVVVNGNTSNVIACDSSIPSTLCLGGPFTVLFDTSGRPVANILGGATPGQNDDSSIISFGLGGSLQGTYVVPLFGHDNHLVAGISLDHGDVNFHSTNELGVIDPRTLMVSGTNVIIDQPDGSLRPVRLETTNSYYGLFASDTFEVTPRLALTLSGRYNVAAIHLIDKLGTALNGNNRFSRFNPSAGATYKMTPAMTAYVGYAEANRVPTAGEIACSDPARPCSLDNFLTADPPGLKQVVAHTIESGLRGSFVLADSEPAGKVDWNLGLFRTEVGDDILNVPSANINSGYFTNIGRTRRQGIEASIAYRDQNWRVSADYSLIAATFESSITLSSPDNPAAGANGNIKVTPGNRIPGVPEHRLKLNVDYLITEKWKLGGNLAVTGDQFLFGDAANQNPPLAGYFSVNLHSAYQITDNIELFARAENLFDRKYATYGIFGDVTKTPLPGVAKPSDPRFVSVAPPLAGYAGMRVKF